MILRSLITAALACAASAAEREAGFPPVQVVEHTVYYPIQGDSVRQIRDQLQNHGPWSAGAGHGRTRSEFELRTELEPGEGSCRLAGAELSLRITTTLPQWQPGPSASDALHAHWTVALERLMRHEDGHRRHAIEAVHELRRSLLHISAKQSCLRAQGEADHQLRNAITRLRMRGILYDQRTGDGLVEPPAD